MPLYKNYYIKYEHNLLIMIEIIFQIYVEFIFLSLTGLLPSLAWLNIVGCDVPSPRSVHRAIEFFQYIIFRKTGYLFPIHFWLVHPLPLVPKLYSLLFSPVHDPWGSWPPPIHHHNVKNRVCGNVLGHTVVT